MHLKVFINCEVYYSCKMLFQYFEILYYTFYCQTIITVSFCILFLLMAFITSITSIYLHPAFTFQFYASQESFSYSLSLMVCITCLPIFSFTYFSLVLEQGSNLLIIFLPVFQYLLPVVFSVTSGIYLKQKYCFWLCYFHSSQGHIVIYIAFLGRTG